MLRRDLLIGVSSMGVTAGFAGCTEDNEPPSDAEVETAEGVNQDSKTDGPKISGSITELRSITGDFGSVELQVNFDYTSSIEPILNIFLNGRKVYSQEQDNSKPVTVEIPTNIIANGGEYKVVIQYDGKPLAVKSGAFNGFVFEATDVSIEGGEYSLGDIEFLGKNTGDLPATIDEFSVTVGKVKVDWAFVIGSTTLGIGAREQFEGISQKRVSGGQYEVEIRALNDQELMGKYTTEVQI